MLLERPSREGTGRKIFQGCQAFPGTSGRSWPAPSRSGDAEKDDDSEQADHRLEPGLPQEMGGQGGGDEGQRGEQIEGSEDFQCSPAHDLDRHKGNSVLSR